MKKNITYCMLYFLISIPCFHSCQKEITVDLPDAKQKIVVDGKIEPNRPPYVILTYNVPYFGPTDLSSMEKIFVHNAIVKISNGLTTVTLTEVCTQNIPDSLLSIVAAFTGVDTTTLRSFNYCLYTTFDPSIWGSEGLTYTLSIDSDGRTLSAATTILPAIPLDSIWFKYEKKNDIGDSLGFIWAHLTDPPQQGNAYRWLTKRERKDYSFVTPRASSFDDKFINGQSFDFAYERGRVPNSKDPDDYNEERGYFKKGDTVTLKFCTIDRASFNFFMRMDQVIYNSGNPFSSPASVPTNIKPAKEALGLWCAYGVSTHTVICK